MAALLWLGQTALEAVVFLACLGIHEGIIKPFSVQLVRKKIMKVAPKVLVQLDRLLPLWIFEGLTGKEMEERVRLELEKLTGDEWKDENLEGLFQVWDVRATLDNVRSSPWLRPVSGWVSSSVELSDPTTEQETSTVS